MAVKVVLWQCGSSAGSIVAAIVLPYKMLYYIKQNGDERFVVFRHAILGCSLFVHIGPP